MSNVISFFNNIQNLDDTYEMISLIIAACMGIIFIHRAFYSTSIESIFMTRKQKMKNSLYKLIGFLIIFSAINFFMSYGIWINLIGIPVFLLTFISVFILSIINIIFSIKEKRVQKYIDRDRRLERLKICYIESEQDVALITIILIIPLGISVLTEINSSISLLKGTIIMTVIEIFLISLCIPELLRPRSRNYFTENNEKIYIYKRLDDEIVLCGDKNSIYKSSIYRTISYEELKRKEIEQEEYNRLSRQEKRALKDELKRMRRGNNGGQRNR